MRIRLRGVALLLLGIGLVLGVWLARDGSSEREGGAPGRNARTALLLYYLAADGSRPGGECDDAHLTRGRNRFLGLALSTDGGETWRKHPDNPLIGLPPSTGADDRELSGEGGVAADGGVIRTETGLGFYLGELEEYEYEAVHADIVYFRSRDGVRLDRVAPAARHGSVPGRDEIYPKGSARVADRIFVYYAATGSDVGHNGELHLLAGADTAFPMELSYVGRVFPHRAVYGGGDLIRLSPERAVLPVRDRHRDDQPWLPPRNPIKMRVASVDNPLDLSHVAVAYDWPHVGRAVIGLDRGLDRWMMAYLMEAERGHEARIGFMSAPADLPNVPPQSAWMDHGTIVKGGACGAWDWWLHAPVALARLGAAR